MIKDVLKYINTFNLVIFFSRLEENNFDRKNKRNK